jgi:hypothetical protein
MNQLGGLGGGATAGVGDGRRKSLVTVERRLSNASLHPSAALQAAARRASGLAEDGLAARPALGSKRAADKKKTKFTRKNSVPSRAGEGGEAERCGRQGQGHMLRQFERFVDTKVRAGAGARRGGATACQGVARAVPRTVPRTNPCPFCPNSMRSAVVGGARLPGCYAPRRRLCRPTLPPTPPCCPPTAPTTPPPTHPPPPPPPPARACVRPPLATGAGRPLRGGRDGRLPGVSAGERPPPLPQTH